MSFTRPLALVLLGTASAQARRSSGTPRQYKIRCVNAECSDRYHDGAPRGEGPDRSAVGRSHRSRY